MIKRIWLHPPLAIARVGASPEPCVSFMWGPNDTHPQGTGSTTLQPTETLTLSAAGEVSASSPHEIRFRDEHGIRPVCPFFELFAEWTSDDGTSHTGAVTQRMLADHGLSVSDVTWEVHVCNSKAYHYTFQPGDRVEARVVLRGDDTRRKGLAGHASPTASSPVATEAAPLPLGEVQLAKVDSEFPELRLRFYAPKGLVYGPRDLEERAAKTDFELSVNREWRGFRLPAERLILNPDAAWARYVPDLADLSPLGAADYRNSPGGLLATWVEPIPWLEGALHDRSLGLLDDVSDGLISCTVAIGAQSLSASARIVVGPPDFAPANRPPVSLADNLSDREDRATPRSAGWTKEQLGELVVDIIERAFETSQLLHKDYQNFRSHRTNSGTLVEFGSRAPFDSEDVAAMLWPVVDRDAVQSGGASALELSEAGTRRHRRNLAIEYLEDRWRESPQLFEQWIRRPLDPNPFFDKRMPALMRGSDGRPLHVTRRQWEIMRAWVDALRAESNAGEVP